MSLAVYESEEWACELISRTTGLVSTTVPFITEMRLVPEECPMFCRKLEHGSLIQIGDLIADPADPDRQLNCILLLLVRSSGRELLPPRERDLKLGDKLLFCGTRSALNRLERNLHDQATLEYILTGKEQYRGWLWRKLQHWIERIEQRKPGG